MRSIIARIEDALVGLGDVDQLRVLSVPMGHDFSSSDYLSLTKHPHILERVKQSVDEEGYGSSSSRFIRGERDIYTRVQRRLADFKRCERTLLFPSGYAANIGVLSTLIKKGDIVFSDQMNHASIIDGLRLSGADIQIYPHLDMESLRDKIALAPMGKQKFLVTESLFSMDGDIAPLDRIAEIARTHDIALIVDEAHAVGLYGPNGAGLINRFGIEDDVLVSVNGLGKAFGCYGAFVAGPKSVMEYVMQRARTLMFTTALPPLAIAAVDAALDIIEAGDDLRKRLFHNVAMFSDALMRANLALPASTSTPIIPVIIGANTRTKAIAERMQTAGFDVKAIRPPSVPNHSARLRITTNLSHSEDLIRSFVEHLRASL